MAAPPACRVLAHRLPRRRRSALVAGAAAAARPRRRSRSAAHAARWYGCRLGARFAAYERVLRLVDDTVRTRTAAAARRRRPLGRSRVAAVPHPPGRSRSQPRPGLAVVLTVRDGAGGPAVGRLLAAVARRDGCAAAGARSHCRRRGGGPGRAGQWRPVQRADLQRLSRADGRQPVLRQRIRAAARPRSCARAGRPGRGPVGPRAPAGRPRPRTCSTSCGSPP